MELPFSEYWSLVEEYRDLVGTRLPARAAQQGWSRTVPGDLGRILLDHAVGGDARARSGRASTALHLQLTHDELRAAIALARRLESEGDPLLRVLDQGSRSWRRG